MTSAPSFSRFFTVGEANQLLAVLRPVMERISVMLAELRSRSEAVIRREKLVPDTPGLMERLKEDGGIVETIRHVQRLVEEINGHGCICTGVEEGLVDFPCVIGEEVVFLCWRFGEESVAHWHGVEEGYAGRRPLLDPGSASGSTYH